MIQKKTNVSIVDKAVDVAFARVAKGSAVEPIGLFMGGLGFAGLGLWAVNADGLPAALKVVGGLVLVSGLAVMAVMALLARKV